MVVCGSLLLHLRDPVRALEAIRSVCRGRFLCTNQIDLRLTLLGRGAPLARLQGATDLCQWWVPNPTAHRHMLESTGWEIERERGLRDPLRRRPQPARQRPAAQGESNGSPGLVAGNDGVPHHAVLARPAS